MTFAFIRNYEAKKIRRQYLQSAEEKQKQKPLKTEIYIQGKYPLRMMIFSAQRRHKENFSSVDLNTGTN